ncbi:MAG: insulinase family protein [Caldiserica bacterium]|nr:insulinase family protein [Caldisericota bacterium]
MRKIFFLSILLLAILYSSLYSAETLQLQNGLQVIWEKQESSLVHIELWVKAGSIFEKNLYGSGISHFVEHMIFKGTETKAVGEIAKKVSQLGGDIAAYTSFDHTAYQITVPRDNLAPALNILARAVYQPAFEEKELEKERKVIIKEMEMNQDNPDRVLSRYFFERFFSYAPYRFPVIGYKDSFLKISRQDLINYHKKMYVPGNSLIVICGGIDENKIPSLIKKTFGSLPASPIPVFAIPSEPYLKGKREFIYRREISLARETIGFPIPGFGEKDTFALDLLSSLLSDGRSSLLVRKLKEDKNLVDSISTFSYTPLREGIFAIEITCEAKNLKRAEKMLWDELNNLSRNITEKAIERAKNRIEMGILKSRESVEGRASMLISDYFYSGNLNYSRFYLASIKNLKKEDLLRVARKYLREDNYTKVLLLPASYPIEKQENRIEKQTVKKITFPSGVRGIFIHKDVPYVNLRVVMGGGVKWETEKNNGISKIISILLLKGKKAQKWIDKIEAAGGEISTYSGNNSLGISITLPHQYLTLGLRAITDLILRPQFSPETIEKAKTDLLRSISMRKETPFRYAFYRLRKNFFSSSPYSLAPEGEIKSVKSLTREEIKNFYFSRLLTSNNTIVGIGGKFQEKKAVEFLERRFARLKKGSVVKRENLKFTRRKKEDKADFAESVVFLAFPIPPLNSPDLYSIEILQTYLSDQASPLFYHLRDEKALGYLVGSFTFQGWDEGMLVFYLFTGKHKLQEAEQGLWEEITKLRKKGIPEKELASLKSKLIRQKSEGIETVDSLLFSSMLYELYGLGYLLPLQWEEKIKKVTLSDIQKTIKKYIQPQTSFTYILEGQETPSSKQ